MIGLVILKKIVLIKPEFYQDTLLDNTFFICTLYQVFKYGAASHDLCLPAGYRQPQPEDCLQSFLTLCLKNTFFPFQLRWLFSCPNFISIFSNNNSITSTFHDQGWVATKQDGQQDPGPETGSADPTVQASQSREQAGPGLQPRRGRASESWHQAGTTGLGK